MATFEYYTYETININAAHEDRYFLIFNHPFIGEDPSEDYSYLYSGFVLAENKILNLNEILSQYVHPARLQFNASNYVQNSAEGHLRFWIYYTSNDWETWTYDTISLIYNWGYNKPLDDSTYLYHGYLSDPILSIVDYRQFLLCSRRANSPDASQIVRIYVDGSQITNFSMTGYNIYTYARKANTFGVSGNGHTVTIGNQTYDIITDGCYRYCLYYANQYGGWDSMLFRGKELQKDSLSRLSYKKDYIVQSTDFHKVDYLTKINETWSLNTSYLNDIQSSKMINIMGSNELYLHDLETNRIIPVNITNTACEHKTYKNQGRKMSVYNLEISASQEKYRI